MISLMIFLKASWRDFLSKHPNWHLLITTVFPFFSLSRLAVALFVYAGHVSKTYLEPPIGNTWAGIPQWFLNPWTHWDAQWFLEIAQNGYANPMTHAFFPLYPFLVSLAPGSSLFVMAGFGILVSNLCFLFSLFFLFKLAEMSYGKESAQHTLWIFCFFPTTAFFSAIYSESLFFLLSVSSFFFAKKKKWLWAGLLGGLAALTRNTGFILAPALLCEYFLNRPRPQNLKQIFRETSPLLLPFLGFAAVLLFFGFISGHIDQGIKVQELYARSPSWPWVPLLRETTYILALFLIPFKDIGWSFLCLFNFVILIMVLVHLIRKGKTISLPYLIYMLPILIMHLSYAKQVVPYTGGALRYIAVTFPYVLLLAGGNRPRKTWIQWVFSLAYLSVCCFHSFYFGQKYFLG